MVEELDINTVITSLLNLYENVEEIFKEKKSATTSTEYRLQANKLYTEPRSPGQKLELDFIIELYTKSVAYAPTGSRELSLAYANRSAALFKARLYDDCLRDIERALSVDYPDKLKAKLFVRKGQSLMALKSRDAEAERALTEARQWVEKMDPKDREIISKTLDDSEQLAMVEEPRKLLNDIRYFPEIPTDNPKIPGALSAIELKYTKQFGRHFVATRDIEPGEILLVELPYASVLNFEYRYVQCENCHKQIWSGIPCEHCVYAIYCTEKCREDAWKSHHNIECQVFGMMIAVHITEASSFLLIVRLAVKAVKEAGSLTALKKILQTLKSTNANKQNDDTDTLDISNYTNVYKLQRPTELSSVADCTITKCSTIFMCLLAMESTFFGKQFTKSDIPTLMNDESWIFIRDLIKEYFQIIKINAYKVGSSSGRKNVYPEGFMLALGMSMFNHSCVPTISRFYAGENLCIMANTFIKKGEQIFTNYEQPYAEMSKSERQKSLKSNWYFDCNCRACLGNWPTVREGLALSSSRLSLREEFEFNSTSYRIDEISRLASAENCKENIKKLMEDLTEAVSTCYKYVKHPCELVNGIERDFIRLTAALRGNYWDTLE